MTDHSALRLELFIALLIFILLFTFVNRKIKQPSDKKIGGKGMLFFNVIGISGLACFVILIISTYLE